MRSAQAILTITLWLTACTGGGDSGQNEEVPLSSTITRSEVRVKEKWRSLVRITSRKPQKTPPFKVSGKEWKVHWKNKEQGELILILYDADNPDYSEILANTSAPDEDVVYLTGKGRYILEVVGKQPYEVYIEELR
ncbi:MAG: hypothetical protein NZZ60_08915 [Bacteroidia bacterium]|nr:hypothetical protein [Bacteroidia bacterium]MCX7652492.1 hypothetical protein [Bacteroidia bacterium]MDW8416685.1 hypothetical protein [Bacteroidia bacterium]